MFAQQTFYWWHPLPQLSWPLNHECCTFIPGSLKGSGVETIKWTEHWRHKKGNSLTDPVWECRLELSTVLLKDVSGPPKTYLRLSLPLAFRESTTEFIGISDVSTLYTNPAPGTGASPGKGICRNLTFYPSIRWAEGQATHILWKFNWVPPPYGCAAKAVEWGWESKR